MRIRLCYFNQHWNIYLYTKHGAKSWINFEPTLQTKRREGKDSGEYRLRSYACLEAPIYSFGFFCDDPKKRPGHGGEWSSNHTSINQVFGVNLYEIAIDQMSVAVPLEWLKQLLGDRVKWQPDEIWGEWIKSVEGGNNNYYEWVELPELLAVNN